jgi:hypothetical protein
MGLRKRAALIGIAGALTATALLAIGILLFGDFGETEGRILATTALLAGYGLIALPAAFLLDRARYPALAFALLGLATAGFALSVTLVWFEAAPAAVGKATLTAAVFGVALAQTAALAARRREHESTVVRRLFSASVGLALVVATMAAVAAWAEIEDNEAYFRSLGALAVLDVLVVALQPILALARPTGPPLRLRLLVAPGESLETTVAAADFASAAARAIRTVERRGGRVLRLERVETDEATADRPVRRDGDSNLASARR